MKTKIYIIPSCILMGLISCSRSDQIIGLNENIHHDDFEYSVVHVEKREYLLTDGVKYKPKGIFLIVTFKVQNKALRVNHEWDNQIAYIETDDGVKYENLISVQKILNNIEPFHWQENYITPHGVSETTQLVFDIPVNISEPYLRVSGTMLMGDVANFSRFKRIKIKLF